MEHYNSRRFVYPIHINRFNGVIHLKEDSGEDARISVDEWQAFIDFIKTGEDFVYYNLSEIYKFVITDRKLRLQRTLNEVESTMFELTSTATRDFLADVYLGKFNAT